MSTRSEEERAINNLGKRIRAVEDALRDSHKLYKDMVQELKRIRRAAESDVDVKVTRTPTREPTGPVTGARLG